MVLTTLLPEWVLSFRATKTVYLSIEAKKRDVCIYYSIELTFLFLTPHQEPKDLLVEYIYDCYLSSTSSSDCMRTNPYHFSELLMMTSGRFSVYTHYDVPRIVLRF